MKKREQKWVRWMSPKNGNDGRRESAIGMNRTKWHLPYPILGEFKVACGIEMGPYETYSKSENEIMVEDICKVCLRKAL